MSASLIPTRRRSALNALFGRDFDDLFPRSLWSSPFWENEYRAMTYEETDSHFTMKLNVAGVDPDTIKVKVKNGVLEISYPKATPQEAPEKEIAVSTQ